MPNVHNKSTGVHGYGLPGGKNLILKPGDNAVDDETFELAKKRHEGVREFIRDGIFVVKAEAPVIKSKVEHVDKPPHEKKEKKGHASSEG